MSSVKGLAGKGKRPLTKMTSKTCSCPIHYFASMNFILNQIQPLQGGVCVPSLVCPSAIAGLRLWVARTASAMPCACWVLGLIWVFFFFFFLVKSIYLLWCANPGPSCGDLRNICWMRSMEFPVNIRVFKSLSHSVTLYKNSQKSASESARKTCFPKERAGCKCALWAWVCCCFSLPHLGICVKPQF